MKTLLKKYQNSFVPIVPIDFKKEKYLKLDLSVNNPKLQNYNFHNIEEMDRFIEDVLTQANVKIAVGGYAEERAIYQSSDVFKTSEGSRSIHLGVDIFMPAGTAVFTPLDGKVHSFQNNNNFRDYGPTIILEHQLENINFYTLYGHLSLDSLKNLKEGQIFHRGEKIAEFGTSEENGQWSPHLHFQIIKDMLGKKGDFIGVAPKSEKDFYLENCPDPNFILGL